MGGFGNPAQLSSVGFGAWEAGGGTTWGPNSSTADVVEAMAAAFDAGVNWVDTAEVYGGGGGSEEVTGMALARHRDVKVCTKVAPEDESHFTERGMRAALQESLRRLGRDAVDVYLLHWPSETVGTLEAWEALRKLKAEGLVGAIGLSNFPASDVVLCAETHDLDYVQIQASLLYQDELVEFAPLCEKFGVGLMAYGALGFGMLSGTIAANTQLADWRGGEVMADDFFCAENYPRWFDEQARARHLGVLARLREAVEGGSGFSLPQLALHWLVEQSAVTAALVGTRNVRHARDNAAVMHRAIDAAQLRRISDVVLSTGA